MSIFEGQKYVSKPTARGPGGKPYIKWTGSAVLGHVSKHGLADFMSKTPYTVRPDEVYFSGSGETFTMAIKDPAAAQGGTGAAGVSAGAASDVVALTAVNAKVDALATAVTALVEAMAKAPGRPRKAG